MNIVSGAKYETRKWTHDYLDKTRIQNGAGNGILLERQIEDHVGGVHYARFHTDGSSVSKRTYDNNLEPTESLGWRCSAGTDPLQSVTASSSSTTRSLQLQRYLNFCPSTRISREGRTSQHGQDHVEAESHGQVYGRMLEQVFRSALEEISTDSCGNQKQAGYEDDLIVSAPNHIASIHLIGVDEYET